MLPDGAPVASFKAWCHYVYKQQKYENLHCISIIFTDGTTRLVGFVAAHMVGATKTLKVDWIITDIFVNYPAAFFRAYVAAIPTAYPNARYISYKRRGVNMRIKLSTLIRHTHGI